MSKTTPPTFRGRTLGIVALTAAQMLIGTIHTFFGALLLLSENFSALPVTIAYDIYTMVYGVLVLVFTVYFWRDSATGWFGTVAISLVVITADTLTILDLPSIPGIPKIPSLAEIGYSLVVLIYLVQVGVRRKYLR